MDLKFPRPEDVDAQESQCTDYGNYQPNVDTTRGTLFSGVTSNRETLLAERNGDIIQLSTKGGEIFIAHTLEFVIGVFLVYIAHERDPIHIAARSEERRVGKECRCGWARGRCTREA